MSDNILQSLVSCKLCSVEFVEDYIQLRFNGSTLNALNYPVIKRDGYEVVFEDMSYMEELSKLTGLLVSEVTFVEHEYLTITLNKTVDLVVPLTNSRNNPENIVFYGPNGSWDVW